MTELAIVVTAIPPTCLLAIAGLVVRDELQATREHRERAECEEWARAWNDLYAAPARQPRSHA